MSLMDLLNPIDRDELRARVLGAEAYPHGCLDNFLKPDFADEVYNAYPSFQQASEMGREFSAVNERGKIQITDSSKFPEPIKKLHDLTSSQEFLDLMSYATNIPNLIADPDLVGGGIHETRPRGYLDVHVDFNYIKEKQWHRRLNILIFFNKNWKDEYKGCFEVWDKDVKKLVDSYSPIFNRCCFFETSNISYHGVSAVTCPPDMTRKSFAAYYYTTEAPAHWTGEEHSTIFKARPEEKMKGKVLMPLETAQRQMSHAVNRLKGAVKSVIGR